MNKKNMYKNLKKKTDVTFKLVRQLIFSVALFALITTLSLVSPNFKETARYFTKKNTDFAQISRIVYEKAEQCIKEYSEVVGIK